MAKENKEHYTDYIPAPTDKEQKALRRLLAKKDFDVFIAFGNRILQERANNIIASSDDVDYQTETEHARGAYRFWETLKAYCDKAENYDQGNQEKES